MTSAASSFPDLCREWRNYRQLSQLDLALAAEVSQRHVSWLETGRSQPSRTMVLRLSEALQIPLRERNKLLQAAGFAPAYRESELDAPTMAPVLEALKQVLDNHEPLPAVVLDRFWNVKMQNNAAGLMMALGEGIDQSQFIGTGGELNLALMTLHPQGFRRYISNWAEAAPPFVQRLKADAAASGDREVKDMIQQLLSLTEMDHITASPSSSLLPILPLELDLGDLHLSLFSVISTFGTPQDITTDELRIEAFYPTDDATRAFFQMQPSASG
ncbi:helix-turn-helix domain-containing protein [Pseudomaricurvus alkylphenolicus]|uniref:helix-turn-helix domain-containing protein n=1 Tax=Pseudomaricurvus alkylphenolicus TaxID=1306991 RepID=UPI0014212B10|nr:helix-turn-helix transcriptional regulator [Pseudomaricurvus alkylphenolicus]NIB42775.1 helix-turn-helix domain-containing protein [Pseudomaricurvus alkylphenolicus]